MRMAGSRNPVSSSPAKAGHPIAPWRRSDHHRDFTGRDTDAHVVQKRRRARRIAGEIMLLIFNVTFFFVYLSIPIASYLIVSGASRPFRML